MRVCWACCSTLLKFGGVWWVLVDILDVVCLVESSGLGCCEFSLGIPGDGWTWICLLIGICGFWCCELY